MQRDFQSTGSGVSRPSPAVMMENQKTTVVTAGDVIALATPNSISLEFYIDLWIFIGCGRYRRLGRRTTSSLRHTPRIRRTVVSVSIQFLDISVKTLLADLKLSIQIQQPIWMTWSILTVFWNALSYIQSWELLTTLIHSFNQGSRWLKWATFTQIIIQLSSRGCWLPSTSIIYRWSLA